MSDAEQQGGEAIGRRGVWTLRRWTTALVVLAGLNGALFAAQELLRRDDVARAGVLETQMAEVDEDIDSLAALIAWHETEGTEIDALASRLQDPDAWYPSDGEHDAALREHNDRVGAWNLDMVQVASAADRHNELVAQHNELVAEYNGIIEAAYARWWLAPFPVRSTFSR